MRFLMLHVFLLAGLLSCCAYVEPYEREFLADPIMESENDPLERAYNQHMHRALSQGLVGEPEGGSGCGCEQ